MREYKKVCGTCKEAELYTPKVDRKLLKKKISDGNLD
jgi:hypothetical protein